jgi:hypothetical protein
MQNADLNGVLGLCGQRRHEAKSKTGRGSKPAAVSRSLSDRAYRIEHRDVPLLTCATGRAPSRDTTNRKECANRLGDVGH